MNQKKYKITFCGTSRERKFATLKVGENGLFKFSKSRDKIAAMKRFG